MTAPRDGAPARLPSGIPGLDVVTGGGLPAKRTTLVTGSAGAGKTVFGMQYLAAAAARGEPGVLVSFEERPQDLLRNVASFGWDVEGHLRDRRLAVVDAAPGEEVVEAGDLTFDGLLARIAHAVQRIGARHVLVEAADAAFAQFGSGRLVRRELGRIVRGLRDLGVTAVVTAERESEHAAIARYGVEQFVADNVVILRNAIAAGNRRRTIEVLKLRGFPHHKGAFPFVINPERGIEIVPVSEIEATRSVSDERISLGNAQLDTMCGGGVYRDSLVLVSGATGTGKSLMGIQFIAAGLAAGERAILFSFEESPGQIARNAASWGFDLVTPEREGRLRSSSRFPGRMTAEDLLLAMEREVTDHGAHRVVLDSMTALEHGGDPAALHDLAIGLSAFTKAHGVATMLITTPPELMGSPIVSGAELSTLTDGIFLLRYLEIDGDLRRTVMVLKLRGSGHDRALHEFEMGPSGMRVLGPVRGVRSMLGGSARPDGSG